MALLLNGLAFQFGWFALVLGGAHQLPWLGAVLGLALVGWHLWQVERRGDELRLLAWAGLLGLVADSLPVVLGLLSYPSGTLVPHLAPYWIVVMWLLFATTLNFSLRWLHGRWWLAVVLGATSGPLAYWAGAKLGAVTFVQPLPALALLALIWSVALPLLLYLANGAAGVETGPQSIAHRASDRAGKPA